MRQNERIEAIAIEREKAKAIAISVIGDNQYFFGGSRRFGWANEMSDVDIFLHLEDIDMYDFILESKFHFMNNGYKCHVGGSSYVQGWTNIKVLTQDYRALVDINMQIIHLEYLRLLREHEAVERFIKYNPWLLKLLVRDNNYTPGKEKYRAIVDAINCGAMQPYENLCEECVNTFVFTGGD